MSNNIFITPIIPSLGHNVLNEISDLIYAWDISESLTGIGFYKKIEKYAHIEIKISFTKDSYSSDYLIWNTPEFKIHTYYKPQIEDFFKSIRNYISVIKGENINLITEITDGSFSITESTLFTFPMALSAALKDCFINGTTILTDSDKSTIENMQQKALSFLNNRMINTAYTSPQKKILKKLRGVELLAQITEKIKNWDFSTLEGAGYFNKGEHYGHIELKIYTTKEYLQDRIIWNIDEFQLPEDTRYTVLTYLEFFHTLLLSLRSERPLYPVIEITNGSNAPTENWRTALPLATVYALVNCFDNNFSPLTKDQKTTINYNQEAILKDLKHKAINFSSEEVFNSLKDVHLNGMIRTILSEKDQAMFNKHIKKIYNPIDREIFSNFFLKNLSEKEIENLKNTNIISKYNRITNIGLGHIGIILQSKEILLYLTPIKDFTPLYEYYDIRFMS